MFIKKNPAPFEPMHRARIPVGDVSARLTRKTKEMRTAKGGDHRRGLFLVLESLAGTAALLLDAKGELEYGNRQACDLLDCAGDDLMKARWKTIAPLFGLPLQMPFSVKPHLCDAQVPLSSGSRPLSLELHALDEGAGHGYFALLRDRSVLDHLERELFLASERRGWGHQCATLMHDLKGILNSMQISLELMSSADAESAEVSPEAARQNRRIATLKEDLTRMNLALGALPGADGNAEPAITEFDARDLIRENFATLRQLVRRNSVELKLELPETPLPARGRRAWIKQALFNVAVHRLNAMRAGGRLVVDAAVTDQGVVVKLRNDVPDMREGLVDEGYRLFCTGRTNGGATDLQVARAIFESQGGAMEVRSGGVDSTVFVMRLPG
jgi:signal transduction histidine kinase